MFIKEVELTQEKIVYIVTKYMLGQDWRLVSPAIMAMQVWGDLKKRDVLQTVTTHTIETIVWQRYAVILHDACRMQHEDEQYQLAWHEFSVWLRKQVRQVTSHLQEQEDVVQEALIELQSKWQKEGLRVPRTLWAYALQTLRRKYIDMHRRRSAKKRGEGKIISLEVMGVDDTGSRWEENMAVDESGLAMLGNSGSDKRNTENEMADQESREQLRSFFQEYLPTILQQQVAEALFLDGFAPKEIAILLGKKPHEIRLLKARIVKRLRNLPSPQRQELLQILDRETDNV